MNVEERKSGWDEARETERGRRTGKEKEGTRAKERLSLNGGGSLGYSRSVTYATRNSE